MRRRFILVGLSTLALVAAMVITPVALLKARAATETLFGHAKPASQPDQHSVTLGTRVTVNNSGTITAVRFYKGAGNTGRHIGAVYTDTGRLLAKTTFVRETSGGWQTARLSRPLALKAGSVFYVAVFMPRGNYVARAAYPWPHRSASLTATSGVYQYGTHLAFPSQVYQSSNYFIDVEFKSRHKPGQPGIPSASAAATATPQTPEPTAAASASSSTAPPSSINGLLTRNPNFFPIAVWDQTLATNGANYKAIGVNTFLGLYNGYSAAEIDAADANRLYAIGGQSSLAIQSPSSSEVIPAWLEYDEPDNAQPLPAGGYGPCIPVSTLLKKYKSDKAADPRKRPIMIDFGRGVSDINWVGRGTCTGDTTYYEKAAVAGDIFAYDIYPVNSGESDDLQEVAQGVDNLRGWVGPNKPVWADIETTAMSQGNAAPTPEQTKFEVWSAIIHGARGINYFCHIFTPTFHEDGLLTLPTMKAAVQQINAQIKELAPVINVGRPVADTVTSSAGSSVPVDTMTRRYHGDTYIIAANMRNKATSATFQPRGVTNGKFTVLSENRTVSLTNGSMTDDFAPYGVHIYKITTP